MGTPCNCCQRKKKFSSFNQSGTSLFSKNTKANPEMDFMISCVCCTHLPFGLGLKGKKCLLLWWLEQTGSCVTTCPLPLAPFFFNDSNLSNRMSLSNRKWPSVQDCRVEFTVGVRGRGKPAGVCANLTPSPLALLTNASSTEHGEPQHSLHRACSRDGLTWGGEGLDCLLPVRTHGSVYVPTTQGR